MWIFPYEVVLQDHVQFTQDIDQCCGSEIWNPVLLYPLDQGSGFMMIFLRIPDI
jgi:hypothetical protein